MLSFSAFFGRFFFVLFEPEALEDRVDFCDEYRVRARFAETDGNTRRGTTSFIAEASSKTSRLDGYPLVRIYTFLFTVPKDFND